MSRCIHTGWSEVMRQTASRGAASSRARPMATTSTGLSAPRNRSTSASLSATAAPAGSTIEMFAGGVPRSRVKVNTMRCTCG